MVMEPQRRKLCGLHLVIMLVTILLLSAAISDGYGGGVDHLADSGGGGNEVADKMRATVMGWSPITIRRGSGHGHGHGHGHSHGHGHGNGNDRGHGNPETSTVFNPRTVTGGHHGRNAAATNPGRSCAVVAACCLFLGSAILLHFL